jgi:hypothetical protein
MQVSSALDVALVPMARTAKKETTILRLIQFIKSSEYYYFLLPAYNSQAALLIKNSQVSVNGFEYM